MNRWIVPGFGGCAAAALIAVLWQAGAPTPEPAAPPAPASAAQGANLAQGEDWGSPDGGAVVIKPGGANYSILVEDMDDHSSVFSEGRVVGRTGSMTEAHSYRLKPTTPGQERWTFEVDAKADGTAELYVDKGSPRHLVTTLKK
jgi:hypothetical protein